MDFNTKNLNLRLKFVAIKKNQASLDLEEAKLKLNRVLGQKNSINSRIKNINFADTNLAIIEDFKLKDELKKLDFKCTSFSMKCRELEAIKANLDSLHQKIDSKIKRIRSISNTFPQLSSLEEIIDLKNTARA